MTVLIPAAAIRPGPNDRKVFDPERLAELAASIETCGLLEPPVVRPAPDGTYELVAGERRFRAVTELLGWDEIPVTVRALDDAAAAEAMLAENFHRVDLNPMEEAGAYAKWADQFGWDADEIARRANVSPNRVRSRLRLLTLIPEIQFLITSGAMKISYTTGLPSLDENRQRLAMRAFRDNPKLTRDDFIAVCSELYQRQIEEPLFSLVNEDWTAARPKTVRPLSRKALVDLVERLAASLPDAGHPLAAEAADALAAERAAVSSRRSAAAERAWTTRRAS